MDFINYWPYDIVDLIFQHLEGNEVLRTMQVSKGWYEHLRQSRALKKIILSVKNKQTADIKLITNSNRKYRHIKVLNDSERSRDIVEIIANPHHKFESITLFRTKFSFKQMEQIILNSSRTLEHLEIHYTDCTDVVIDDESFWTSYEFPKLRILCLYYHNLTTIPWINKFIANYPNLETLTLGNACDEHMKNLILTSKNLRTLVLSGKFHNVKFFQEMSEKFPSQLDEFVFNDILSSSREDENLSYFNAFFKSQSKTLKRFDTDALLEIDELQTAFNMPKLQELNIKGFHYSIYNIDACLMEMRTKELPVANLTKFSVHFMNQHLLELLAMNARNLLEMRVSQFHPCDVANPTWFQKLESLKLFFVDSELRKTLEEKPKDQCSHFEKMIIESMSTIQPFMLLQLPFTIEQ